MSPQPALHSQLPSGYALGFDLSSNLGGDNTAAAKSLGVNFTGGAATVYTVSHTTPSIVYETLSFTANSGSTLLTFTSGASGYSGAEIDNVSVTAVPEPQSYALMLAGLGLMGAVVRRRKNKSA